MTGGDLKAELRGYLQAGRDALLWKLEGLDDNDARRPLVPTGTNLLGLVKHVASVEAGYLGETFGRPFPEPLPWLEDAAATNADMWATLDESREQLVGLYHRVWSHSDATIDVLGLDAVGRVPWWPEDRREVTLHRVLVHMIAETDRHAGHADIVRELIDGAVGLRNGNDNMAPVDQAWWQEHRTRLQHAAEASTGAEGGRLAQVRSPHGHVELVRSGQLAAGVPYAYAAVAPEGSRLVLTAGACPLDEDGATVAVGDVAAQTEQAMGNLHAALQAAGADLTDVVKTTVYVATTRQEDLTAAWAVVNRHMGDHDAPSTLVGVTVLGYPDQLVEVEAIATPAHG